MKYPKVIGIRFCDNDFYNTIIPFLRAIGDVGLDHYQFDKTKFSKLCKYALPGFYWSCQNCLRHNDKWDENDYLKEDNSIKRYLAENTVESRIYFDEEVAEFLKENKGWYNSEFFVIDTSAFDRKPYIYSA